MPDSKLIQAANSFRSAILRRERAAAVRLIEAYGLIWNRLAKELAKLNQQIAEARASGEAVNQFWLFRQQRYFDLLGQVDREFKRFAGLSEAVITKQQSAAVKAGLGDSVSLMEAAAESAGVRTVFNRVPVTAVENLVGALVHGSPLRTLLDQLPVAGRQIVNQGLVEGIALGLGPAQIARQIRAGLGGNLVRALTISRTETLRAYRQSSLQTYQANADVVRGWYWRSSRSSRSCAACIALDGTFHPVIEPMRPHPRCRCTMIPAVKGITVDSGTTWFNEQDAETQKEILGTDAGYKALKAGDLKLEDFVGLARDPLWGDNYIQLSVKRALAGEGQFPE